MDCPIDWLHYGRKHWELPSQHLSGDTLTAPKTQECLSVAGSAEPTTPKPSSTVSLMATEEETPKARCRKSRKTSPVLQMYGLHLLHHVLPGIRQKPRNHHGRRQKSGNIAISVKSPERSPGLIQHRSTRSNGKLMTCEHGGSRQLRLNSPSESPRLWLPRSTLQAAYDSPKSSDYDSEATSKSPRLLNGHTTASSAFHSEVSCLERWDIAVIMYSTMTFKEDSALRISHDASFTVSHAQENSFDKPMTLSILIRNGPRIGGTYKLKSGEYTLQLPPSHHIATDPGHTVEIVVEREPEDMTKRLRIRFTCVYPATIEDLSIRLPVIYPKSGKVLSEKIWLEKPWPPYSMHPVPRDSLTSWQFSEQRFVKKQVLCFRRPELPSLIPEGMKEDAVVRFRHLQLAPLIGLDFPATKVDQPSDVIKSLSMAVNILPGQQLECRMSFDLHVGQCQRLLAIEAAGWRIKYASIDGQPCTSTKGVPQWWEEDDLLSLYRNRQTIEGTLLEVAMSFIAENDDWLVRTEHSLPRLLDKSIFGGVFTCSSINALVNITQAGSTEEFTFTGHCGDGSRRLPSLTGGYKLRLCSTVLKSSKSIAARPRQAPCKAERIRFSGGMPLRPRAIRFEDDDSIVSADTDGKLTSDKSSYFADDERTEEISDLESLDRGSTNDDSIVETQEDSKPKDCSGKISLGSGALDSETDDGDLDVLEINDVLYPGVWFEYVLNAVVDIVKYLEQMSPMHFLVRFLIFECVCLGLDRKFLDEQPRRSFPLNVNVSDMFSTTVDVLLGDFDASVQPLSNIKLDEGWQASQNEEVKDHVAIGSRADSYKDGHGELKIRDRIDLALGWRPLH